jgi:hypothetical protein
MNGKDPKKIIKRNKSLKGIDGYTVFLKRDLSIDLADLKRNRTNSKIKGFGSARLQHA